MRISVFVGVSIDGFIAEPGGSFDFLKPFEGEEHGYTEHFTSIDAIVTGRGTYDVVLGFGEWPWSGKRVVVLTHRPIVAKHGETAYSGALAPLAAKLESEGVKHVYLDGGIAIRQGLDEDLVDAMTISTVPRTIGAGIPLFPPGKLATKVWTLVASRPFPSGLVQSRWERAR